MKEKIDSFSIVSFDIFDTLLSRKLARPKDVFSLMQSKLASDEDSLNYPKLIDDFAEIRIQSEALARKKRCEEHGGEPEVLIHEIYESMKCILPQLHDQFIESLISLEIETESNVLFKNAEGEKLFNLANEYGKKIYIISDMYLPSEVLRHLLTNCGYNLNDCNIYSSGEKRASKHSGDLYELIKKENTLDCSKWLHVGDNLHADIDNAKKRGISVIHANWSEYDHAQSSHWKSRDVIGESIVLSLQQKQSRNLCSSDPLTEIGFNVFGPLLMGFTSWIAKKLEFESIDKALFLARDAHLIFSIYNDYYNKGNTKVEYLYLSRSSTYKLGMTDWPMHRIWHLFGGKNKKSIKKIFSVAGLEAKNFMSDIHNVGFPDENYVPADGEEPRVHWLINKCFKDVLYCNTLNRSEFSGYFKDACEGFTKIALIDVGWMGNIQSVFSRSLGSQWAEKEISGYYLATFQGAEDNRSIYNGMYGWLTNYGLPKDKNDLILSGGVELMEFAMADNTGSTMGYMKDGDKIIPIREDKSESENDYLIKAERLQKGIRQFFAHYGSIIKSFNPEAFSSTVLSEPFFKLISAPSSKQLDALTGLTHAEAAGSNAERIHLFTKLPLKERLIPNKRYFDALEKSYWKEGFRRTNRKKFWSKY